jgi:hypothetical protein
MRKNKYVPAIILLIAIFAPSCFAGTFWITNMSSTDSIMGMGGENDTAIEPHDVKDAAKKGILGRDPWIVDAGAFAASAGGTEERRITNDTWLDVAVVPSEAKFLLCSNGKMQYVDRIVIPGGEATLALWPSKADAGVSGILIGFYAGDTVKAKQALLKEKGKMPAVVVCTEGEGGPPVISQDERTGVIMISLPAKSSSMLMIRVSGSGVSFREYTKSYLLQHE